MFSVIRSVSIGVEVLPALVEIVLSDFALWQELSWLFADIGFASCMLAAALTVDNPLTQ